MTDEQLQDFRFRDTTRAPYSSEVNVRYDRFGGDVVAETADISMEGMFIRSDEPRPVGTLVQFEISLGDGQEMVQGLGDVVWIRVEAQGVERPTGMGIQFRYIDTASRERIRRIVASYIESEGAPAAGKPVEGPVDVPENIVQDSSATENSVTESSSPEPAPVAPAAEQSRAADVPGTAAALAGLSAGALTLGESESFVESEHDVEEIDFGATVQLPPGAAAALTSDKPAAPAAPDFLEELAHIPDDREGAAEAPAPGKSLLDGIDLPDPSSAATAQIPTAGDVLSLDLEEDATPASEEEEEVSSLDEQIEPASELPTVTPSPAAFELPALDDQPSGLAQEESEGVEESVLPETSVTAEGPPAVGAHDQLAGVPEEVHEEALGAEDAPMESREPAPVFDSPPSSEWDDLLAEKPNRSGLFWLLGAVALLAVFAVLGRERIAALIGGQPPPAPVELAEASPMTGAEQDTASTAVDQPATAGEATSDDSAGEPTDESATPSDAAESALPPSAEADSQADSQTDSQSAEPPVQQVVPASEPAPRVDPEPPAAQASPTPASGFRLLGVSAEADEAGTTVFLRVDSPVPADALRYSRLNAPPRYVVKVRGTDSRPAIDVSTSEVQQIRTGLHDVGGVPEVHLVFDLATEELDIEPSAEGQLVRIRLSKR